VILVVWTIHERRDYGDYHDEWTAVETMPEAEKLYDEVLATKGCYIASICGVIKSTDYSPAEGT